MRYFFYFLSTILLALFAWMFFDKSDVAVSDTDTNIPVIQNTFKNVGIQKELPPVSKILNVPYISEAPEGDWSGDWVNACEEASIAMVENYYKGGGEVHVLEAKRHLQELFDIENKIYGNNKNTDAKQMLELITDYSTFDASIKQNPDINEIKNEIVSGRPVISLHRGFDLKNPNIPFSPTKSSYHTVVVVGFDDISKEFITHDPGDDTNGANHRYSYDDFMFSLHDYNKDTDKTDGVPTVLFTKEQ